MNFIQKHLASSLKRSMVQLLQVRQISNRCNFTFSQPQSKNFVMKKSELSNELLISLSMGFEHKEATNQKELTENLIINNVLKSQIVQDSFNELDRQLFGINKKQKMYANNPLAIGKGQNMTSPLMHAIALEEIYQRLLVLAKESKNHSIKILDIGCGRGYVAFAIAKIIQKIPEFNNFQIFIKGIDIHDDLIQGAQVIQQKLGFNNNIKFEFATINIENEVLSKSHVYDIIHTGVALDGDIYNAAVDNIYNGKQDGSCIICPVIQKDLEQNLILRTNNEEHVIMKCVYSQMISVKQEEVSKYFLEDGEYAEDEEDSKDKQSENKNNELDAEAQAALLENTKMQRDIYKYENQLKIYEDHLKSFHESFKKNNNGRSPTLQDFNKNEDIKNLLLEIQSIKKNIKFTKAKLQQAQL